MSTIEHRMLDTLAHKQALADGVLDRIGDLTQIRLTSGRQSFLARLNQLVAPADVASAACSRAVYGVPGRPAAPKPLPVDRAQAFCERALETLRAGLVRCEERYPLDGPHSVVVAVVERDAALWREKLQPVHQELLAIQHRLPEPASAQDAALPLLSLHWADSLPLLRDFLNNPAHDWRPVTDRMLKLVP